MKIIFKLIRKNIYIYYIKEKNLKVVEIDVQNIFNILNEIHTVLRGS